MSAQISLESEKIEDDYQEVIISESEAIKVFSSKMSKKVEQTYREQWYF